MVRDKQDSPIAMDPAVCVPSAKTALVKEMPGRSAIDAALMARVTQTHDRSALQDLAIHYGPRLKAFLMQRGEQAQTAEDIAQDVIIKVWSKADMFDADRGSFSAWVFRMTRNCWLDHKRKHDRMSPTAPDIMAVMSDDIIEGADMSYDRREAARAVRRHLAGLPSQYKEILHHAFFDGLSHTQISERTGLPLGTVKGRIRSALKTLRRDLNTLYGPEA